MYVCCSTLENISRPKSVLTVEYLLVHIYIHAQMDVKMCKCLHTNTRTHIVMKLSIIYYIRMYISIPYSVYISRV